MKTTQAAKSSVENLVKSMAKLDGPPLCGGVRLLDSVAGLFDAMRLVAESDPSDDLESRHEALRISAFAVSHEIVLAVEQSYAEASKKEVKCGR